MNPSRDNCSGHDDVNCNLSIKKSRSNIVSVKVDEENANNLKARGLQTADDFNEENCPRSTCRRNATAVLDTDTRSRSTEDRGGTVSDMMHLPCDKGRRQRCASPIRTKERKCSCYKTNNGNAHREKILEM